MELKSETINFLTFIILGVIIGSIFDVFRALRKIKKYNNSIVYMQDVIFFIISGTIISFALIFKLESSLRIYLFLAIFLGIVLYIVLLSKYVLKIFVLFFNVLDKIIYFITIPLKIYKEIFTIIYIKLSVLIKKCCNKFLHMIFYFKREINKTFFNIFKFKRGKTNE